MTYQERRSIVSLVSTIAISAIYYAYMLPRFPAGDAYSVDVFHFWGKAILILIPISMGAKIAIRIAFNIVHRMVTHEKEPSFADERDKAIVMKSLRNSYMVFMVGFLFAMISLVMDMPPSTMFIILIITGIISEVFGDVSQVFFYRRGF